MKVNEKGIKLIKSFESLELKAYQDVGGIWTIGYGFTEDVKPGMTLTREQADDLFTKTLSRYEKGVESLLQVSVNENQFSALVSLAYNIGLTQFKNSTLLSLINQEKFYNASNEFQKWIRVNGKKYLGLVRRREAEKELYLEPV